MTREDKIFKELARGDKARVEELVKLYYEEIFRYCFWHMKDKSQAEDAVQETFYKVFRYFDDYRHKGKFRAFLYKVAANTCIDMNRRGRSKDQIERRMEEIYGPGEEAQIPFEEANFTRIEAGEDFQRLIRGLPEDSREIVVLRFGQELKLREIGEVMNLPLRTVQSKLRAALKYLEKEVKSREKK